jgi:hypothetical protein
MPNKTLVSSCEKEAKGFKKPKEMVTLMACTNATGSIKFPLVFIHKSRIQGALSTLTRIISQLTTTPKKLLVFINGSNKSSWCCGLPERANLLVDNAPSHPDVELLKSHYGKFSVFACPQTPSLIQPGCLKPHYTRDLLLGLLDDVGSPNIAEFSQTLKIKDAVLISAELG